MKIGNYTADEILEFMTEGEGRGFLGRSMFDAMYFEIERLKKELEIEKDISDGMLETIDEAREYIESYMPNYDFDKTNLIKLLGILKGSDKE